MTKKTDISRIPPLRMALVLVAITCSLALTLTSRAQAQVYCVDKTDASCSLPHFDGNLQGALDAAEGNPGADTVLIGPGTQISPNGFSYNVIDDNPVEITGSGVNQTELRFTNTGAPGSGGVPTGVGLDLQASAGTRVSNLTIEIPAFNDPASYDAGLVLGQFGSASHIAVVGPSTDNVVGIQTSGADITDSTIDLPHSPDTNLAVRASTGFPVISGTDIRADTGIVQQDPGTSASVVRSRISAITGLSTDGGDFEVEDSLIDLGSADHAVGVLLSNSNSSSAHMSATLDGVSIVGDGTGTSTSGIVARADQASETTDLTVRSSVISGTENSMKLTAEDGRMTTATVSYSAFDPAVEVNQGPPPALVSYTHSQGNVDLTGDPKFKDAASGNYTPLSSSPLIDKGDPAPPAVGVTDILGNIRACNGTPGGNKIRDIGAFEYNDCIDPDTSINGGPGPVTEVPAPGFTLASDKPFSTFLCSFDDGPEAACDMLLTAPHLGLGTHHLAARAVDIYGNTDKTPATYDYTVIQTVGPTCETDPSLCPPADKTPPVVKLTGKVPKKTTRKAVKIRFKSSESGSTFTCRVGKAKAKKCRSPYKAKLKKGRNVVVIVATDKAGNLSKPKKVKITRK